MILTEVNWNCSKQQAAQSQHSSQTGGSRDWILDQVGIVCNRGVFKGKELGAASAGTWQSIVVAVEQSRKRARLRTAAMLAALLS